MITIVTVNHEIDVVEVEDMETVVSVREMAVIEIAGARESRGMAGHRRGMRIEVVRCRLNHMDLEDLYRLRQQDCHLVDRTEI